MRRSHHEVVSVQHLQAVPALAVELEKPSMTVAAAIGLLPMVRWSNEMTLHKTAIVDGLSVFYREGGTPGAPKLVLLGGFPASSHQFRNLIPALADRFHVISPDYPGFGNTDMPDPATFPYTFDRLSEVVE